MLPGVAGLKTSDTAQICEKFTSLNEFQNKVEVSAILTKTIHLNLFEFRIKRFNKYYEKLKLR